MHTPLGVASARAFGNRQSRYYSQALQPALTDYGAPMEEIINNEDIVQDAAQNAFTHLSSAGIIELTCAFALPLLALLIGRVLNRKIDEMKSKSIHTSILDWAGPLIAPLLAVIFLMISGYSLRALDFELHVLPFVWKLAVAWFAIQLVSLMSSRQGTGWMVILVIVPITLLHLFELWEPVTESLSNAKFTIGEAQLNAYGILKSIAALIALFWLAGFMVKATDKRLRRIRTMHTSNRTLIMKIFQIFLYFIVFLIGLQILGVSLTALSVLGGALGVGIGFGLQKIASNFISGIILLFEKSVSVDDMIQLEDGTTGFIRQNAARYTLIEIPDGREIMIPNEEFITQRVTTLTHSNRRGRISIEVGVHYDSDLEKVRALLIQAAQSCPVCLKDPAPNAYITGLGDSAINTLLVFWLPNIADGSWGPKTEIIMEIIRLFRENNVSIPYPHQVQVADPAMEERFTQLEQHLLKKQSPTVAPDEKDKKKPKAPAKK